LAYYTQIVPGPIVLVTRQRQLEDVAGKPVGCSGWGRGVIMEEMLVFGPVG
jgi:hypothetical protein